MEISRAIILILAMTAVLAVSNQPCAGDQNGEESIFTEDDDRGPERGPRRGPGRGRFELTDEEIDRIMEGLKQRSPEKAKELEKLREEEP